MVTRGNVRRNLDMGVSFLLPVRLEDDDPTLDRDVDGVSVDFRSASSNDTDFFLSAFECDVSSSSVANEHRRCFISSTSTSSSLNVDDVFSIFAFTDIHEPPLPCWTDKNG